MIDFRCGLESYLVNKVVQANQQAQFKNRDLHDPSYKENL